jgi:hypothetical protein
MVFLQQKEETTMSSHDRDAGFHRAMNECAESVWEQNNVREAQAITNAIDLLVEKGVLIRLPDGKLATPTAYSAVMSAAQQH